MRPFGRVRGALRFICVHLRIAFGVGRGLTTNHWYSPLDAIQFEQ